MVAACVETLPLYRPRDPQASDLWRLLDQRFDCFQQVYDERFAAEYGFWREGEFLELPELDLDRLQARWQEAVFALYLVRVHAAHPAHRLAPDPLLRLVLEQGPQDASLECIATRRRPVMDVEIGHRITCWSHLGNIAYLLGRKLRWDPVAEHFLGDEEADRALATAYREPWSL